MGEENGIVTDNLAALAEKASAQPVTDMAAFCGEYLQIFNEGIHYSFIASVAAMLLCRPAGLPTCCVFFCVFSFSV